MSLEHLEKIKCPECGTETDFPIWASINTKLNPEMEAAVRDMSIFRFVCPHCGAETKVNYPVLYHQMEDSYMVYYVPSSEDIEVVYKMFRGDEMSDEFRKMTVEGYLYRIALTQNQLREKLLIFDEGLDDRIIEVMKIFMIASVQKQQPNVKITEILYDNIGEDKVFVVLSEDGAIGTLDYD